MPWPRRRSQTAVGAGAWLASSPPGPCPSWRSGGSPHAPRCRPLAHAGATIARSESIRCGPGTTVSGFEDSRQSLRTNAKSSMTHHSLEQYVVPATTSSVWHPARKMGRQASDCWMLFWSMQALSSQIVGSVPVASRRCLAHWLIALCVAPGAPSSSRHEWLRNDVTPPIVAGTVLAARSAARSAASSWLAGRQRKLLTARLRVASGSALPTSAAIAAASSSSVPRRPRRPRRRWSRPRLRRVATAAHRSHTALDARAACT